MESKTTATQLISALRASFCCTGVPDTFWSDGGPQFTSKQFKDFAKQWSFRHATSAPQYPQSNGKAEATVKSMKKSLRAAWTGRPINHDHLARALLQYRFQEGRVVTSQEIVRTPDTRQSPCPQEGICSRTAKQGRGVRATGSRHKRRHREIVLSAHLPSP